MNPLEMIDMLIEYYKMPVIDSLSDMDKGIHQGRYEGLLLARMEIMNCVNEYRKRKDTK